jgi:hypothetical protein
VQLSEIEEGDAEGDEEVEDEAEYFGGAGDDVEDGEGEDGRVELAEFPG